MVLYNKKRRYAAPIAEFELFTTDNVITTSSQDSGENPPIIIRKADGSLEMFIEGEEYNGPEY